MGKLQKIIEPIKRVGTLTTIIATCYLSAIFGLGGLISLCNNKEGSIPYSNIKHEIAKVSNVFEPGTNYEVIGRDVITRNLITNKIKIDQGYYVSFLGEVNFKDYFYTNKFDSKFANVTYEENYRRYNDGSFSKTNYRIKDAKPITNNSSK